MQKDENLTIPFSSFAINRNYLSDTVNPYTLRIRKIFSSCIYILILPLGGFRFSEVGGANFCGEGSRISPFSHNFKITPKKKRHLTVSNIVKCLYFSGFTVIRFMPFVSIKRFSFPNTSRQTPSLHGW